MIEGILAVEEEHAGSGRPRSLFPKKRRERAAHEIEVSVRATSTTSTHSTDRIRTSGKYMRLVEPCASKPGWQADQAQGSMRLVSPRPCRFGGPGLQRVWHAALAATPPPAASSSTSHEAVVMNIGTRWAVGLPLWRRASPVAAEHIPHREQRTSRNPGMGNEAANLAHLQPPDPSERVKSVCPFCRPSKVVGQHPAKE